MKAWPHQVAMADSIADKMREYGLCYVSAEERTGKTLAVILAIELLAVKKVLVVTKKAALDGWTETLMSFKHTRLYKVTNYHQASKLKDNYDIIVLDEAHNYISGIPEPSAIHRVLAKLTVRKPIIYMSATPCAQGPAYLYHQLSLSTWSPFRKFSDFYDWHGYFGIPYTKYVYKRQIAMYDQTENVMQEIEHLFVSMTRNDIGFEHEPEDKLHYITLDTDTLHVYGKIENDKVYKFLNGDKLVADTVTKLRYALHMLEGGTIKIQQKPRLTKTGSVKKVSIGYILANREKIDYILNTWGDSDSLVVMFNYVAEEAKLKEVFKKATVLQATKFAEGIDLSGKETLVIYSQDYSTARHTQRRARQANLNRESPITVHYLLVKGGISDQVYETVSVNKTNYVDEFYRRLT